MLERIVIALLILVASSFGFYKYGSHQGAASKQAEWNESIIIQKQQQEESLSEFRRIENARNQGVINAQNAATSRIKVLEASNNTLRIQSGGLRGTITATTSITARGTPETCPKVLTTFGTILDELIQEAEGLARAADGHATDSLMYQEAWPTK